MKFIRSLVILSPLFSVLMANPSSAAEAIKGVHVKFVSQGSDDCNDLWDGLKTYNWPQFSSLESFGGTMAPTTPCSGYKNIYGSASDVLGFIEQIRVYQDRYNLEILDVKSTRITGSFRDQQAGGALTNNFERTFEKFEDLVSFWTAFQHSGTVAGLPAFMESYFGPTEYAETLRNYFANNQCLTQFTMEWQVHDQIAATRIARKATMLAEICP